mmetsp:Transcript_57168/g.123705  ORF Transcript_57168/g.123705 Transcript_57168/m.123705 type:complete len:206 (-) Transcript_57168:218-835(-)
MQGLMLKTPTRPDQLLAPRVARPPTCSGASVIATARAESTRRPDNIQRSTSSASNAPSLSGTGPAAGSRRMATRRGSKNAAKSCCSFGRTSSRARSKPKGSKWRHCLSLVGPSLPLFSSKASLKASKVCISSGWWLSQWFTPGSGTGSNHTSAKRSVRCSAQGAVPLKPIAARRAAAAGTSNSALPLASLALLRQRGEHLMAPEP